MAEFVGVLLRIGRAAAVCLVQPGGVAGGLTVGSPGPRSAGVQDAPAARVGPGEPGDQVWFMGEMVRCNQVTAAAVISVVQWAPSGRRLGRASSTSYG